MAAAHPEAKIQMGALLVGKYRVTREIGRGGMAAVYEAEHIGLGKKVAVKVLAAELSNSAVVIERFFREARAAASVKSPYIVDVYDSGRLEDGRPFIAMELLVGESLYDRMARVRIIDPVTTVRVITQCAKGLMKAHAAGIVHRDLKPENIHLTTTEEGEEIAKILDFGLAKFYAPVRTDEKTARLTREGAVFGTPAYMSPEQVKGQGSVDHRADLWALGCMAYECVTGRPVWNTDQGVAMTFAAIAASPLPVPSKLRPDLPPAFDEWFKKALERDASKRFQTAKELADALARAFNTPHISLVNLSGNDPDELERIAAEVDELPSESVRLLESNEPPPVSQRPPPPRSGPEADATAPQSMPRPPGLSATDLPPTAGPESPSMRPPPKSGVTRYVLTGVAAGTLLVGLYIGVSRMMGGTKPSAGPVPSSSATGSAATNLPPVPDPTPPAAPEDPKWWGVLAEGQHMLASGDADGAIKKFNEAYAQGGGAVAKAFIEQVKIGSSTTGPCKLVAFSHPRLGYEKNIGRPAVAVGNKGAVVVWTDDHEQSKHDHAYSVILDPTGRPTSKTRDLTPEGDYVMRPALMTVDEKFALLYWDRGGNTAGVSVRWLDEDGQIASPMSRVGPSKMGDHRGPEGRGDWWPTMDRAPDGFWVAWQDDRDKDGTNLFLRHLDSDLKPTGNEIRATDYVAPDAKSKTPQVRVPSVTASQTNLFVAYSLDRDDGTSAAGPRRGQNQVLHLIERMRVPLTAPELKAVGLEEKAAQPPVPGGGHEKPKDRELGEVTIVNDDKIDGDLPAMACVKDGCYLVWQGTGRSAGAQAAFIDPNNGVILWHKKFATNGSHPALGVSPDGQVSVAFYEGGRVRIAALSRGGVGTTTTFAKVTGDQPRPWIAGGRLKGEWYVAWQDVEAGHTEAYVARLSCRN